MIVEAEGIKSNLKKMEILFFVVPANFEKIFNCFISLFCCFNL